MKKCTKCGEVKELSEFNRDKYRLDGRTPDCRICRRRIQAEYYHTKDGLVTRIYSDERAISKKRKDPPPSYTKEQLKKWLFSQPLFHLIFKQWKDSGFYRYAVPSVDRINDMLPYSMSNIQLMRWKENEDKGNIDVRNGKNTKGLVAVVGIHIETGITEEFYSVSEAHRKTGAVYTNIKKSMLDKTRMSGGYVWYFKKELYG
jgi:hypothetical protein